MWCSADLIMMDHICRLCFSITKTLPETLQMRICFYANLFADFYADLFFSSPGVYAWGLEEYHNFFSPFRGG
jgi:hypothetical protein